MREDLKVIQYQSQEADNTFITSDGTSPYNSTRKWAVKRHYREDNNQHPHNDINYEKGVIRVLRHTELSAGDPIRSIDRVGCRMGPLLNVFGNEVWIFLCKN